MSNEDSPAFPYLYETQGNGMGGGTHFAHVGMSLREYAAIHLRVPNSGVYWLDEMIREASGQQSQLFVKKPGEPQYSTPDYLDGEWHDWHGGECPVSGDAIVDVLLRSSTDSTPGLCANRWDWGHRGDIEADIIRFRVVKP